MTPFSNLPKATRYMDANAYFNEEPHIKDQDKTFNMETVPVDFSGGVILKKPGNGCDDPTDMLKTVQDNVRERFGLKTPSDYADDSDIYDQ